MLEKLDLVRSDLAGLQQSLRMIQVYAVEGGPKPDAVLKANYEAQAWLRRQLAGLEP